MPPCWKEQRCSSLESSENDPIRIYRSQRFIKRRCMCLRGSCVYACMERPEVNLKCPQALSTLLFFVFETVSQNDLELAR